MEVLFNFILIVFHDDLLAMYTKEMLSIIDFLIILEIVELVIQFLHGLIHQFRSNIR